MANRTAAALRNLRMIPPSKVLHESLHAAAIEFNTPHPAMAAASSDALVDVSNVGENCPYSRCDTFPGYQVGPGYDLGTGLGSPDINDLLAHY